MTETIEPMVLDEADKARLAQQLVAQARSAGIDLVGPDGLLTGLTKQVLETALEERQRREAVDYILGFYEILDDPRQLERKVFDDCRG